MKSDIYSERPNFSIILPGGCQAHCAFCFWKQKKMGSFDKWINKLIYTLDTLPECFDQISITGGEPTLSPLFHNVLCALSLRKDRWKKIVLTTNGGGILEPHNLIQTLKDDKVIDFINISRHHFVDAENQKIFKTKKVPSRDDLKRIADKIGNKLTFNCVYSDMSYQFFGEYMKFAEEVGVKTVCFRRTHGSLDMHHVEANVERLYMKIDESSCPVCRSTFYSFSPTMVCAFKYSLVEPKEAIDGVYELIYQQDGKLTTDWEGMVEVDLIKEEDEKEAV